MTCNYKIATLTVAIITIIFAGFNLFKLYRQTDEDISRFLCYHPKHDDHKDMLRRTHQIADTEHVKSHTIEKEEESFADKIKKDDEEKREEMTYDAKIDKETRCRMKITPEQIKGFRFLNKFGIAVILLSVVSTLLVFVTTTGNDDANRRRRYFLIPYIVTHTGVVSYEIFATIYAYHLSQHKVVIMMILLLVVSISLVVLFITFVSLYYRFLASGDTRLDSSAKEAFDYSVMVEEKNVSET